MITSKAIILVLPHIDGNRTSLERFKSFICALKLNFETVKIVYIKFPKSGDDFLGVNNNQIDNHSISTLYQDDLIIIKPRLNLIQSLFFKWANKTNRKLIKPLIWFHQLIYGDDVFTPTYKIKISDILIPEVKSGFIVAFGGPFGIYSVANYISEKLNYKLILDYRDPWTFGYAPIDGYQLIHTIKKIFKNKYERELLNKSVLITTVSHSLKAYFPIELQNKIHVLPNGYNSVSSTPDINPHPQNFTIVYTGTIYDIQLLDDTFFKALKIFIADKDSTKIKLLFIGSEGNQLLQKKLKTYDLNHIATITKRLNKQDLSSYMTNASCFLHLRYGSNNGIITSKQSEYLAYRKAILLPNSDNGDIAESIINNNSGVVCNSIRDNLLFLNDLWDKFLNHKSLTSNSIQIDINSRENVANEFVKLIAKA